MPGANSPKTRDYFITANPGAECYEDLLERINEGAPALFALITHDKDKILSTDEDGNIHEEPKTIHKHAVIEWRNPISFSSMLKRFPGAHIVMPKYKRSAYQYLIHNSPNSKEKYQYPLDDIISNNIQQVKLIIETEQSELFYSNQIVRYMAQGVRTVYQFVKRFGMDAGKQYWKMYKDVLDTLDRDTELQADYEEMKRILEDELPF